MSASSLNGFWQSVVVMSRALGTQRMGLVHGASDLIFLRTTWPFIRVAVAALAVCAMTPGVLFKRNNALILWILIGYMCSCRMSSLR